MTEHVILVALHIEASTPEHARELALAVMPSPGAERHVWTDSRYLTEATDIEMARLAVWRWADGIREAALAFLHGEDWENDSLAHLADALDVPLEDVEALR